MCAINITRVWSSACCRMQAWLLFNNDAQVKAATLRVLLFIDHKCAAEWHSRAIRDGAGVCADVS